MPKLVRFVLLNSVIGIVLGWVIAAAVVYYNIGHLGELLAHTQYKAAAIAMLGLTFGITFGFAYLATAVMLLPTDKDDFDRL